LGYLDELDYMEPKTASFEGFPKFWHEPNLWEWWVGIKEKLGERMAMRSNYNGLLGGPRAKRRVRKGRAWSGGKRI
jgi:hypothetical protein